MPLDRAKIRYMMDDLRSRPDRLRLVQRISISVGVVLLLTVAFLLSRAKPPPPPKVKATDVMERPLTPGVQDAFEYAKAAQPILDRDQRYAKVYFVPSAATPSQKHGKVVVMGELAGETDLQALQRELAQFGVTVPVDWQVSLPDAAK